MNKLTITDKVFVPMKVTEESVKDIYGVIGTIAVKEETNKYVLSREELEKVISEGFDKLKPYVSFNDLEDIKEEFINSIL